MIQTWGQQLFATMQAGRVGDIVRFRTQGTSHSLRVT